MARYYSSRWWIPALAGVVIAVGGVAVILWRQPEAAVASFVIGALCVVYGILLAGSALVAVEVGYDWAVLALQSLFAFALGLPLVLEPHESPEVIGIVVGVMLLLGGVTTAISSAVLTGHLFARDRELLKGVLAIVTGALLLGYPSPSLKAVIAVAGSWMLGSGTLLLMSALMLAGFGKTEEEAA